jgi:hypothetical protein
LLLSSEKPQLRKSKAAIALFAILAMHNKKLDIGGGHEVTLSISPDIKKRLAIFAFSEVAKTIMGSMGAGMWLFETRLAINEHCEPGVAPPARAPFVGDFEMTPLLKLARA